jgi:3-oxoacyl-[acyl-carrier-protein] synthase II
VTFSAQIIKNRRVAIVAAGVVSPLGCGLTATLESLRQARDCVTPLTRFQVDRCRCKTAGQIDDENLRAASAMTGRRAERIHRAAHMIIAALREALSHDGDFKPETTIFATTSGGMSFGEQYYRSLQAKTTLRRTPGWIANYPPQKPVVDGLEACGISGPCQVIANACASGTNAIGHAFECVRSGRYDRILTGGYDALSELVFVGFDSLQASTPEKCRPFDRERSGMVLGEGAAVLCLEEMNSARKRGAQILGEVTGYGISTDNHHLTQPDPSGIGARRAMEQALESAGLEAGTVDYINAHGTATPFNDAAEGVAMTALFGDRVPVSSTKAMMGHSLGAAGAIEAVVCILAMQNNLLPPNINFRRSDEAVSLDIVANAARSASVATTLSNSFGFGGTNASIVMQKEAHE